MSEKLPSLAEEVAFTERMVRGRTLDEPRKAIARLILKARKVRNENGDLHPQSIYLAGVVAKRGGKTRQAAYFFTTAYRYAVLQGSSRRLRVAVLSSIAGLFYDNGHYSAAELCLRKALESAMAHPQLPEQHLASLRFNLGVTLRNLARPSEAFSLLDACLMFRRSQLNPNALELLHVLTELAELTGWFQDATTGRAYFNEAKAALVRTPDNERDHAKRYLDFAELHLLLCEREYQRALEKLEELDRDGYQVVTKRLNRVMCLSGLRRWSEALVLLDELLDDVTFCANDMAGVFEAKNIRYKIRRAAGNRQGALEDLRWLIAAKRSQLKVVARLSEGMLSPGLSTVLLTQLWEYLDLTNPFSGQISEPEKWSLFETVCSYKNAWRDAQNSEYSDRALRNCVINNQAGDELKELYKATFFELAEDTVTPAFVWPNLDGGELFVDVLTYLPCIAPDQIERSGPEFWGEKGYFLSAYRPEWSQPRFLHMKDGKAFDARLAGLRQQVQEGHGIVVADVISSPLLPADWLDGASTVYLRADGLWHSTPIDADNTGSGAHILTTTCIHLITHTDEISPLSVSLNNLERPIVVSNPDFSCEPLFLRTTDWSPTQSVYLVGALRRLGVHFPLLPDTIHEATLVQTALGTIDLRQRELARGEVLARAATTPVLHIATHAGYLDRSSDDQFFGTSIRGSANPPFDPGGTMGRVYLAFAGVNGMLADPLGRFDSGAILTAEMIAELDLSGVTLVVLSACESGLGYTVTGEGVVGLPGAFLRAGVKVVVHSLWPIGGEGVHALMRSFYNRLRQGMSVGQALSEAKRHVRDRGAPSRIWASFQCTGAVKTMFTA